MKTEVDVALLIAGLSLLVSILSFVGGSRRNNKKDTQKDTETMTTVVVELKNIATGVSKIEGEMGDMKRNYQEVRDKVVSHDTFLATMTQRIDQLEKKGG